jgi:hypothetical protein
VTLFEWLSIIGVLLAGMWSLLQYYASVKKELDAERFEFTKRSLGSFGERLDDIGQTLKEIRIIVEDIRIKQAGLQIRNDILKEAIHQLEKTITQLGKPQEQRLNRLEYLIHQLETEQTRIGKDLTLIRTKRPEK